MLYSPASTWAARRRAAIATKLETSENPASRAAVKSLSYCSAVREICIVFIYRDTVFVLVCGYSPPVQVGIIDCYRGWAVGVPDCITDAELERGVGWQLRQKGGCRYRWRRDARIAAGSLFRHELTLFLTYVLPSPRATVIYLADFFATASKKFVKDEKNTPQQLRRVGWHLAFIRAARIGQ